MSINEHPLLNLDHLHFPEGLLGLEEWKLFSLQQTPDMAPVAILHCTDEQRIRLIVADPHTWFPTYAINIPASVLKKLDVLNVAQLTTLVIINVEPDPFSVTANLVAPLLINLKSKIGVQVVLENSPYIPRQPLTMQTKMITFKEGIAGLEEYHQYILQTVDELRPIKLLVCEDQPRIYFPVIDPWIIYPDFKPILVPENTKLMETDLEHDFDWLVILTIKDEPFEVTANLIAPILISKKDSTAYQVILSNSSYKANEPVKKYDADAILKEAKKSEPDKKE